MGMIRIEPIPARVGAGGGPHGEQIFGLFMEVFSADCTAGSSGGFLAKIISKALSFTVNGTCLIIR
jgi:hypothetical protein